MTETQWLRDAQAAPFLVVILLAFIVIPLAVGVIRLWNRPLPRWLDRLWLTLIALSAVAWFVIWAARPETVILAMLLAYVILHGIHFPTP